MEDKATKILDTAVRLFADIGVGVATAKIAKEAGVSNGTLFNYFPTKQNLIDSSFLHVKRKVLEELLKTYDEDISSKEGINITIKSFIYWGLNNPTEYKTLTLLRFSNALSKDALEQANEIFKVFNDCLKEAISEKEIIDAPIDYIPMFFGGNIEAMIAYINEKKLKGNELEKFLDMATDIIWNGIKQV